MQLCLSNIVIEPLKSCRDSSLGCWPSMGMLAFPTVLFLLSTSGPLPFNPIITTELVYERNPLTEYYCIVDAMRKLLEGSLYFALDLTAGRALR